jgi:energy-coupling factor transporter transmembrane protein EcfT
MEELPLDKDDLLKLKGKKTSNITFLVIFVLFLGGFSFLIFRMEGRWVLLGIPFFVFALIFVFVFPFLANAEIDEDIKTGKKTGWRTEITKTYHFTINRGADDLNDRRFQISLKENKLRDIEMPRELLNKLNVGDEVYLEYANVSKTLIKFVVNGTEHSPRRLSFTHWKNGIDLNKP